ncbi:MAG: hypothetical protein HY914_00590 [Desulfomonile tiedjei]|nr:hypothetical protein [Desulfomonile tiedjei]
MDYSAMFAMIIVLAGIGGFIVLARTLLENWKAGSRGKEDVDAEQSEKTVEFERCYNACMAGENWEPDKDDACKALCR